MFAIAGFILNEHRKNKLSHYVSFHTTIESYKNTLRNINFIAPPIILIFYHKTPEIRQIIQTTKLHNNFKELSKYFVTKTNDFNLVEPIEDIFGPGINPYDDK